MAVIHLSAVFAIRDSGKAHSEMILQCVFSFYCIFCFNAFFCSMLNIYAAGATTIPGCLSIVAKEITSGQYLLSSRDIAGIIVQ